MSIPGNIAIQIREQILRGVLAPGFHLRQGDLAERFNASVGPIREALKQLSAEGMVLHDHQRGAFVATISSNEVRQLYRMRSIIETELLSTINWPTLKQLSILKKRVIQLERVVDKKDMDLWSQLHRDFHEQIFNFSPHKILVRENLRLWAQTDRYRCLLPVPQKTKAAEDGTKDEYRLLEALENRDRLALLMICEEGRTHIEELLVSILAARGL